MQPDSSTDDPQLFAGLLVIDCASFIAAPVAATILSDFGARVIKIEPPGAGDSLRKLIKTRGEAGAHDYFWTLGGRNKESLALDLARPAHHAVLRRLIARADVFITNFPLPTRERLALTAEQVTALNPRLIYASLTPYGEAGEERGRTGYDTTAWWARSGLMDMVRGYGDAEHAIGVPGMGDHPTAVTLYAAIVTALLKRERTGRGGVVATSLLANGLWSNACQVQAALCGMAVAPRPPRGQRSALSEVYTSADGRAFIVAMTDPDRDFPRLARAAGRPEWIADPRYANVAARLAHAGDLALALDAAFRSADWANWRARLEAAGIAFGLVATIEDHVGDPQIQANGLTPAFQEGGGLRTIDSPFQLQGEAKRTPRLSPAVGEHSRAVLAELGYSAAEIEALYGSNPGSDETGPAA